MKTYKKYDNQRLLHLMSQDNKEAFTELYHRFWEQLFAIAFNRTKEKQAAEDIVHDVFTGLWVNRRKVNILSLENYLAVSVKYAVLNSIKRKIREREIQLNNSAVPVIEITPEMLIDAKMMLAAVKKEVEKLPVKCRLIFKYSREAGMPVKEIANEMHLSPKTVENQLTKALRHLRLATRSFM